MEFLLNNNINIDINFIQIGFWDGSFIDLSLNISFLISPVKEKSFFFYYFIGEYAILGNNVFLFNNAILSNIIAYYIILDFFSLWVNTMNTMQLDLINSIAISDYIRYFTISPVLYKDYYAFSTFSWWEILNGFPEFEENFELNAIITLVHNYLTVDNLGFLLGWDDDSTTHQKNVNIICLFQSPYVFFSNNSYFYYPLQSYNYFFTKNNYVASLGFFDQAWFIRERPSIDKTELVDFEILRDYNKYYSFWFTPLINNGFNGVNYEYILLEKKLYYYFFNFIVFLLNLNVIPVFYWIDFFSLFNNGYWYGVIIHNYIDSWYNGIIFGVFREIFEDFF